MGDDSKRPPKNDKETMSQENKREEASAYDEISKKLQAELLAFIDQLKKKGDPVPKNKNDLLELFLTITKQKNSGIHEQYTAYLTKLSGKTDINQVTFNDLSATPIGNDGMLSAHLAERQADNIEKTKQTTVFTLRKNHYTNAIKKQHDKKLLERWEETCNRACGEKKQAQLISANQLLPSLQRCFQDFFASLDDNTKKEIQKQLADETNRPTINTYLLAFEKAGYNLKDSYIKNALLKDTKTAIRKTQGALSLDRAMVKLTQLSLLETGLLTWEAQEDLGKNLDNAFAHTELFRGLYTQFPRERYLGEKQPFSSYKQTRAHIQHATSDEEAEGYKKTYEQKLIQGYLDRITETIQKEPSKKTQQELIQLLTHLYAHGAQEFSSQLKNLEHILTSYLQEEFLEKQLDATFIKEKFVDTNLPEKYFPAYLDFWKQIYDLHNTKASLSFDGRTTDLVFTEKKLLLHPEQCTGPDSLDKLFSFSRTIDFKKSHPHFAALFGNNPSGYVVDTKTNTILDTMDKQHEFDVYLGETNTQHRYILDTRNLISITDKRTNTTSTGYPKIIEDDEDEKTPSTETLLLVDAQGQPICAPISIKLLEKPGTDHDLIRHIDASLYDIQAHTRTLTIPSKHHLITQMINGAAFQEMGDDTEHIFTKEITPQEEVLDTPTRPDIRGYISEEIDTNDKTKKKDKEADIIRRLTSYTFGATKDIPTTILKETKKRFPSLAESDIPMTIKAWNNKGQIYFHMDYFCKKYGFRNIGRKDGSLQFTNTDGSVQTHKDKDKNIQACLDELYSARHHEIAHRLFEFHDIKEIPYTDQSGKTIAISQETLCEIADRKSLPRIKDKQTDKRYVDMLQDGNHHRIFLEALEQRIASQYIPGFTRGTVIALDAKNLTEYQQDYDKFTDLIAANTSQPNNAPTITRPTVETSRTALMHQLRRYIEQVQDNYVPTNQQQTQLLQTAQQHLDDITNQETALQQQTVSQAELDQMHGQHIAAAQFLQQNNTPQPQPQNPTPQNPSGGPNQPGWPNQPGGPNQPPDNTPPDQEEQERGKEIFDQRFASLKGDSSAKVETGTSIFLQDSISNVPGGGFNRVKYTIVGFSGPHDSNILLELCDASEKKVTSKATVELPRNEIGKNKLNRVGKNMVYKIGKSGSTKGGFIPSAQKTVGGKRNDIKDFTKQIQDDGKKKGESITHVGVLREKTLESDPTENILYSVDRGTSGVTVSTLVPDGDASDQKRKARWTKYMDYDTFQMFCFSKSLNPYTKTEVDNNAKQNPGGGPIGRYPGQSISLKSRRKALKDIPEKIKKKFEEEQEFQLALANESLSKILPNSSLLFSHEIQGDLSGIDGVIWQRIQKFKSARASTSSGDKADVHDVAISGNIEEGIFKGKVSSRREKYRAAGALLFALERGGMYFRKLSPYANKDGGGRWVRILLGDEARQAFIKERQRLIDIYKSKGGTDTDLQSRIVKLELQFIENGTKDNPMWGSKFGREIEIQKDALYGGAKSIDAEAFKKKGDFPYMFDTFWAGIKQNIPRLIFSTLEAMKGAVERPDQYNQFYLCVLAVFATGMVHMLPYDYIIKLKGLGRSRGIPIALLAGDAHASGKAMRILHHIAKNAQIPTFTDFSGVNLATFDAMHIHNYEKDHTDIRNSFGNRRGSYGDKIINAFNYKNDFLIDVKSDSSLSSEDRKNQEAVTSYLGEGCVFAGYKGIPDDDSMGDGQTPFFEEGLLNLAKGPFRTYMLNAFSPQGVPRTDHVLTLWSNFSRILDQFSTNIQSNGNEKARQVMTILLYKKFIDFFSDELNVSADQTTNQARRGKTYKELFDLAIKGDGVSLDELVRKGIIGESEREDKYTSETYITHSRINNGMAKDVILKFASVVKASYGSLRSSSFKSDVFQ